MIDEDEAMDEVQAEADSTILEPPTHELFGISAEELEQQRAAFDALQRRHQEEQGMTQGSHAAAALTPLPRSRRCACALTPSARWSRVRRSERRIPQGDQQTSRGARDAQQTRASS